MRYFINRMHDFVPGSAVAIDKGYWKEVTRRMVDSIVKHLAPTMDNCDGGLYVGCAGVAYALYYLAVSEPFADMKGVLLSKAKEYLDTALAYANAKKRDHDQACAFLLGGAGVYAVGSVICDATGQGSLAQDLRNKYQSLSATCQPVNFFRNGSDELFVGRSGYICGALFLNHAYHQPARICSGSVHLEKLSSC